jgi:hypothetical protein
MNMTVVKSGQNFMEIDAGSRIGDHTRLARKIAV